MDGQNPKGVPKATLRELLAFARPQRATLVLVCVMGILGTLAALVQPLEVSSRLEAITAGWTVWGPMLLLVALFAADAGLSGLQGYLLSRSGEGMVLDLRSRLAGHPLRLPVATHDGHRSGHLLSRVSIDTTLLRAALTSRPWWTRTGSWSSTKEGSRASGPTRN